MSPSLRTLFAGTAIAVLCVASTAGARNTVVGLSPYGKPAQLRQTVERLAEYLTHAIEPGERAAILDADRLRLIGTFTVPDKDAYRNPRAKIAVNKPALRALLGFAQNAIDDENHDHCIDLPGLLRHVGTHYPARELSDLIVFGSPIFDDPRMPAFSMAGGRVPSDAHIASSRADSPFGTAEQKDGLRNYRVYFATASEGWDITDRHAHFVERFWSLMIAAQGGRLATFTGDPATLFQQAGQDAVGPRQSYTMAASSKLEMVTFQPLTPQLPIYDRPLSNVRPRLDTLRNAEQVEVAISWACADCDFDLFARPGPTAEVIYFGHPETPEGQLFKDYRQSPAITGGFETISFKQSPIDLTRLRLAVNFFAGHVRPGEARGEVRIAIGGHTWARPFKIAAADGNKGDGAGDVMIRGRVTNAAWVIIDPLAVTGHQ